MANTTKKTTKTNKSSVKKEVNNIRDYSKEIEELKQMVALLTEQNKQLKEMKTVEVREVVDTRKELNPSRMIKVISLCSNQLDLSQYEHGQGKVYRFNKLGVSKNIPANILDDIISAHLSLAEKGYFYICDEEFVREHGLEGDYANLVQAEVIDSLFKENKETIKEVLSTCKLTQLDTILDVVAQKVIDGKITLDELEDTGKIGIINKICRERKDNPMYNFKEVIEGLQELGRPLNK